MPVDVLPKGCDDEMIKDLNNHFMGECTEVGMYLAMSRQADREGYPEVAEAFKRYAWEEAEHASKFAELLGDCVWDTKTNLEKRMNAEAGACEDKKRMNLIGRCEMDANFDNPFFKMDEILAQDEADVTLVDFHGEATSEKGAMAWYLDGRVQALWGTHTHVPTADGQVLPQGLGFVTDLGMTGPAQSVIGIRPEQAINRFLGGLPQRFQPADGPQKLNAVLFTIDTAARRCTQVQRLDIVE